MSTRRLCLNRDSVDLTIGDRRTLHAFAAFLRYAGPRTQVTSKVTVHQEWHDWLTGKGPCPDPDSEVGPTPYTPPADV